MGQGGKQRREKLKAMRTAPSKALCCVLAGREQDRRPFVHPNPGLSVFSLPPDASSLSAHNITDISSLRESQEIASLPGLLVGKATQLLIFHLRTPPPVAMAAPSPWSNPTLVEDLNF